MTTNFRRALAALFCCVFSGACAESRPVSETHRLALPEGLREISGLTGTPQGTLLAIADEVGVVFKISFDQRTVRPYLRFGQPPVRADFEGLTLKDDWLWSVTSDGTLYKTPLSGGRVESFETGVGKKCEVEGLAADHTEPVLWVLCKEAHKKKYRGNLWVFAWHMQRNALLEARTLKVPFKDLQLPKGSLPSGLAISEAGRVWHIVSARQRWYLQMTPEGQRISARELGEFHVQAEGVWVDGAQVYIADEGRTGPGQLSRYSWAG